MLACLLQTLSLCSLVELYWMMPLSYLLQALQLFMPWTLISSTFKNYNEHFQ